MKERLNRLSPQPNDIAKSNRHIINELLGSETAKKYAEAGSAVEASKGRDYFPSTEDLKAVNEATVESNKETKAEETKRLWMVWADKFDIDKKMIEYHATFQENGDVVWKGRCDFSGKGLTEFPPNFVEVTDDFLCNDNQLISLIGCPRKITSIFDCSRNSKLKIFPIEIKMGEMSLVIVSLDQIELIADLKKKEIFYSID